VRADVRIAEERPKRYVIRGGRLVDPQSGLDRVADVLVEDGKIAAIGPGLTTGTILDATGLTVMPGFCDAHVHLREPGNEEKETVESGTRAAARGGVTAVACMPNTVPAIDNRAVVEFILSRPRYVKVHPIAAITKGREGKELTEYADLREAGVVGLSDDGRGVQSAEVMRRAMEYARPFDLPLIQHCQDESLSGDGVMHEGLVSTSCGFKGIPWTAEAIMLARDLLLLEQVGGRLHAAHLSCRQSVELVREAKRRGLAVTAEACPHHFVLSDEAVRSFDPCTKVNPPLREPADVEAILAGVADGTIDLIASDHAPHTGEEKALEYNYAPFGISGIETMFALSHRHLVEPGTMSLADLVDRMAVRPRKLLRLPEVALKPGSQADLCLADTAAGWTVDRDELVSRGKNTAFHGHDLTARVMITLVDGSVAWADPTVSPRWA
jgi:dihydroorotase